MRLTGTSPLLMHNIRLADPEDDIVEQIKKITAKKSKQTKDDRAQVSRLEWRGSLYTAEDQTGAEFVAFPTFNIRRSLEEVAKVRRLGASVRRAVSFPTLAVPLEYPGPEDIDKLYEARRFRHRAAVGIGKARTMRIRPQFVDWSLNLSGILLTEALDFDALADIADLAGKAEGLGDYRTGGFGRFKAEVVEVA
jgi:hypothetical protein